MTHSTEQPCLSVFSHVGRTAKKPCIMPQGLASFIPQAGETLPAVKWDSTGTTSEVTFNVSQSREGWQRGTQEASLGKSISIQLFKPEFNLKLLWKRQYLKQTWVLFVRGWFDV